MCGSFLGRGGGPTVSWESSDRHGGVLEGERESVGDGEGSIRFGVLRCPIRGLIRCPDWECSGRQAGSLRESETESLQNPRGWREGSCLGSKVSWGILLGSL